MNALVSGGVRVEGSTFGITNQEPRLCKCGEKFKPNSASHKYCKGEKCPAHPRYTRPKRKVVVHTHHCKRCNTPFTPHAKNKDTLYCSHHRWLEQSVVDSTREDMGLGAPAVRLSPAAVTEEERLELAQYSEPPSYWRPKTRADCMPGGRNEMRPCPYVSCRHHLAIDVLRRSEHGYPPGTLVINFPDRELDELPDTCELDVADEGGVTLNEIGCRMNVTRERARQLEVALEKKLEVKSETDHPMARLRDLATGPEITDGEHTFGMGMGLDLLMEDLAT